MAVTQILDAEKPFFQQVKRKFTRKRAAKTKNRDGIAYGAASRRNVILPAPGRISGKVHDVSRQTKMHFLTDLRRKPQDMTATGSPLPSLIRARTSLFRHHLLTSCRRKLQDLQ